MYSISYHSKKRIMERTQGVDSLKEAKRLAKQAKRSGKTIGNFTQYPKFLTYLRQKRDQTNSCTIRIYKGNIYIWRGKNTLVTAHPIPERYLEEMEVINNETLA